MHVDVENLPPFVEAVFRHRLVRPGDAGAADHDVDAAEGIERLLGRRGHVALAADIQRHRKVSLAGKRSDRLLPGRLVAIPERNPRTALRHSLGGRQADTRRSAGDHRKPPLEIDPVHVRPSVLFRDHRVDGR